MKYWKQKILADYKHHKELQDVADTQKKLKVCLSSSIISSLVAKLQKMSRRFWII